MEAGSLLQEALSRQADQQTIWHSDHALWLDIHLFNESSTKDTISFLLELAKLNRQVNHFFQSRSFDWHSGGDGPVFGIQSSDGLPHLRAICRYGASVADEWVAVEFLRQFTSVNNNFAAECWDVQDGQILLIESSVNGLPAWVDRIGPEACRHRCWMREGKIQLIVPKIAEGGNLKQYNLDLRQALKTLGQRKTSTNFVETPSSVQRSIQDCVTRFYGVNARHKAVLAVPRPIAFLIKKRPDLVNAAIVAFANHALHPETTKNKSHTNVKSGHNIVCEDWVWTTHSFTRTNYAMIRTLVGPSWKTGSFIPKDYQSVELKRLLRQCSVEATPHLRHAVHVGVRLVAGMNVLLRKVPGETLPLRERRALHYWPRFLQEGLGMPAQWILEAWQAGPHHAVHNLEDVLHCPVVKEELESQPLTPFSHPEAPVVQQIQQLLKKAENEALREYLVPRRTDVDSSEDWMLLTDDVFKSEEGKEEASQLDAMLQAFQSFMVDQSGLEGVAHKDKSIGSVLINPRVFFTLLQTVLDPSATPTDIDCSSEGEKDDAFFSKEDYSAILPTEDVGDDNDLPIDTDVVEIMAAMDEELEGAAATTRGSIEDSGDTVISKEGTGEAVEEARILSDLLQSLDVGAGWGGPVQSMMKAMGQEPPLMTT